MLAGVHFCRAEKTLGCTESNVIEGVTTERLLVKAFVPPPPGIPSRRHERPVMETWMASLGSGTTEWSTRMTSMMFTVMLKN